MMSKTSPKHLNLLRKSRGKGNNQVSHITIENYLSLTGDPDSVTYDEVLFNNVILSSITHENDLSLPIILLKRIFFSLGLQGFF